MGFAFFFFYSLLYPTVGWGVSERLCSAQLPAGVKPRQHATQCCPKEREQSSNTSVSIFEARKTERILQIVKYYEALTVVKKLV